MFRPYKFILRPSKKTDPRAVYVSLHFGILSAYKILLEKCKIHKLVYVELVWRLWHKFETYVPIYAEMENKWRHSSPHPCAFKSRMLNWAQNFVLVRLGPSTVFFLVLLSSPATYLDLYPSAVPVNVWGIQVMKFGTWTMPYDHLTF